MENEEMKSDSLLRYSHISPQISKLVAEDVRDVDQKVEEMLQLIELNGDFSLENGDGYHLKQAELIAHVQEFSRRYHLLAERYSGLTGELQRYIQPASKMQNNGTKVFSYQQNPSSLTPEKKLGMQEFEGGDFTFDLSVSSGRGPSDVSRNEGSGLIMLSSDSDTESYNSSPNDHLSPLPTRKTPKHMILNIEAELSGTEGVVHLTEYDNTDDIKKVADSGRHKELLNKITTYEEQLRVLNQRLRLSEEEIARLKSVDKRNETLSVKLGSLETQFEAAKNEIKMHEVHMQMENNKVSQLKMQINVLETELESEKSRVLDLQESITRCNADLESRDYETRKLTAALNDASQKFDSEKAQLEARISHMSERLTIQEARAEDWEMQSEQLAKEIKQCEAKKIEMKSMHKAYEIRWQDEIDSMALEVHEKNECINTMNKNLDRLKVEYDMLQAEKDGLNTQLQTVNAELRSQEKQVVELECRLHQLQSENVQLSVESENASKATEELRSRVMALEQEVERQRLLVSDRAEEKREAIRQLCFALDHYRNVNEELRNAYIGSRRPAVRVS